MGKISREHSKKEKKHQKFLLLTIPLFLVIHIFSLIELNSTWKGRIYLGVAFISMMILLVVLYKLSVNNKTMLSLSSKLKSSEELFKTIFEQAPIGIAIGNDHTDITNINPMFEKIIGRSLGEFYNLSWKDITHPEDLQKDLDNFAAFKSGIIKNYSMEKRYIKPDGSVVWVNMVIAPLVYGENSEQTHICLIEDITERMEAAKALCESERSKAVLLAHLPGMAYRCRYDREWTMEFVSEGCYALTGYQPESLLYNKELSFNDLIEEDYREVLWYEWKRILAGRTSFKSEYEIITAANERKWVLELGQGIYNENGEVEALEGIVIDISDKKIRDAQITFLSDHDFLTGLYNRQFIEKSKVKLIEDDKLPLSVIIADIDGLRLINDAFGAARGDMLICETARILGSCCRQDDILARTGGDEFAFLLPKTDEDAVSIIFNDIMNACQSYNAITNKKNHSISLSIGYATMNTYHDDINNIIKIAEDYMFKRKLLSQESSHSAILSSIMATMYERSQETEEHAERIASLSKLIGVQLNLPQKSIDELELFAMLHDIGKVGIDDRILNKPGKLKDDEWAIMKKHPEIGYRIAMSSPELEPVAEYILSHHERWDGKGYPKGLKEEEIPLISRILSVVDAFDAMTEDRVYRKGLTVEEAVEEIRKNAGTQFDPNIAKIFIESIFNSVQHGM